MRQEIPATWLRGAQWEHMQDSSPYAVATTSGSQIGGFLHPYGAY